MSAVTWPLQRAVLLRAPIPRPAGVGGRAAPSSLVMFGISHSNAFERSTVGCSRPPGKRCSLCARIRHDRAHICREDDGRGTSRSHATACSRRAAPRGKQDGFVAGTRAPRSGLPRVSVRVLASMRTGSPDRRCSCTLCCTVPSRSSSATSTWSVSSPPGQATHATTSPQGTHYSRCTPRAPPRASRASNPPTPATTRPQRAALAGLPAEHTSRAAVTRMASLERSPYLGTGYDGEDAAGRQSARVRPARPEGGPPGPSPSTGLCGVGREAVIGVRRIESGLVLKKEKKNWSHENPQTRVLS